MKNQGYVSGLGLSLSTDDTITDLEYPEIIQQAPSVLDKAHGKTEELLTDVRRKNGDASVYKFYLASSGYSNVGLHLVFTITWIVCSEFSSKSACVYDKT